MYQPGKNALVMARRGTCRRTLHYHYAVTGISQCMSVFPIDINNSLFLRYRVSHLPPHGEGGGGGGSAVVKT